MNVCLFCVWLLGSSRPFIKSSVDKEWKYSSPCVFFREGASYSETSFSALLDERFIVFKSPHSDIIRLIKFGGVEKNLFDASLRKKNNLGYLGSPRLFMECGVNSEIWNRCQFEGTTLSKQVWFLVACKELLIALQKRFWAGRKLFIKCSLKFGSDKTPFWCNFVGERNFQKLWNSETWD